MMQKTLRGVVIAVTNDDRPDPRTVCGPPTVTSALRVVNALFNYAG